ncbi:MAG: galactose-1-phosphate uridylyltransferase [Bryobacteraceae bacterium]
MSELRWHPLLEQWVVVTAHRQGRPQMPADWCPFCALPPYDVHLYPNDFPAFEGGCDVVLYSPDHHKLPSELPVEQWEKVIALWTTRTAELQANPHVKHIMIFENAGEAVGVTMPHPHGQIYAFPFVPPRIEKELASVAKSEECLYCLILAKERENDARMILRGAYFDAFSPYFARFPYETCIYSRRHIQSLVEFTPAEIADFALVLSQMRKKYDALFGFPMPLMMVLHQNVHFYVEFLPLQRTATKLKYLAAVESAAWTFLEDVVPEDAAAQLRNL